MSDASRNAHDSQSNASIPSEAVDLIVAEHTSWPVIEAAGFVVISGTSDDWSATESESLIQAIGNLPDGAALCLKLEPEQGAENRVGLDSVAKVFHCFSDRAFAAFEIGPDDTIYGGNERQRLRRKSLNEATAYLADKSVAIRWLAPLCGDFVYKLEGYFSAAQDLGAQAVITRAYPNEMSPNDRLFADDFIRHNILEGMSGPVSAEQRSAYMNILAALEDGHEELISKACRAILHSSQRDAEKTAQGGRAAFLMEAVGVLADGARAHLGRALLARQQRDSAALSARFQKVLLIGAYGGEHIGDAAILGGVLLRLHEQHGVKNAVLMTQRPAHTKHLTPMIETPVEIEVREYLHAEIDACIADVDAVVFAGGPIVDLPKQLVRHLYAATRAKSLGKPFLMEGIGPGPLPRLPSRVTARKILELADYISLRTRDSADAEVVQGLELDVGRDPAFDYLDTRQGALAKIAPGEKAAIADLLADEEGRSIVGVNIRPIYHQYTVGVKEADKASYTKMVEDRFERRLAQALTEFSRNASKKPIIVFFPMNAVQFGLSDMKSAYRIGRHLPDDVDYRVWEADASLDGVLALIRRLDVVVAMRFHAAIFALSQGTQTLGVDYRIGARDKVAAVLSDVGKGDQCLRIDEMTTEWLVDQLERFAGSNAQDRKTG